MTSSELFQRLNSPGWVFLGGALLAMSMPPLGLYPLAWLALVPLFVRWSSRVRTRTLFLESFAAFFLMAVGSGFWMLLHPTISAALQSGIGLALAPLPHALAFTVSRPVRRRFGLAVGLIVLITFILAVEYLVAHLPLSLPWLLLGNTQAGALPFNQIADLGGIGLLTFFVLAINTLGFLFVRAEVRTGIMPGARTLVSLLVAACLAGAAVYGEERLASLPEASDELAVGLVQPANAAQRWGDATDWQRVDHLATLSERLVESSSTVRPVDSANKAIAELIVWPELSIPYFDEAERQDRLFARLNQWSAERDVALLTGVLTRSLSGSLENGAILFQEESEPQRSVQVQPLPAVAGLSFLTQSPLFSPMGVPGEEADLSRAATPTLFSHQGHKIGTAIGLESLWGDHFRELANGGADLFVTLAQSGWWGRMPSAEQHLGLTRLRAIETRRALVMATVSGPSAFVYPDGRIEPVAGWMEEDVSVLSVPLHSETTYYIQHGDWIGRYALFGAGLFLLLAAYSAVTSRPPPPTRRPRARGLEVNTVEG